MYPMNKFFYLSDLLKCPKVIEPKLLFKQKNVEEGKTLTLNL